MKQHGPWKIKSSEVKYKNPWLTLREDQAIRDDGVGRLKVVVEIRPGISVLPIDEEGNVYLCKEYRYAANVESIHPANGGIENGEAPLAAAQRELKEELGIEAKEWTSMGTMQVLSSKIDSLQTHFLAESLTFGKQQLDGTESITVVKLPIAEAVRMVFEGKIVESMTAVLILKAAKYLGKL